MSKFPSKDFLENYLELDPCSPTGLRWLVNSANKSNSNPGKPAGCKKSNGYYWVELFGKVYPCHRLVLILSGVPRPPGMNEVDHVDRDRLNNSVSNLRWVDRSKNCKNKAVQGGVLFRYVHKKRNRFVARYRHPITKRSIQVGSYTDPFEAYRQALAHRLENHWIES